MQRAPPNWGRSAYPVQRQDRQTPDDGGILRSAPNQLSAQFIVCDFRHESYILRHGEIEDYLPNGCKDSEGVIKLAQSGQFREKLGEYNKERSQELERIASQIIVRAGGKVKEKSRDKAAAGSA